MLEGQVEVVANVVVAGDGFEEAAGDAVGIGVEEAEPAEVGDLGERVEELRQAVLEAEVFAVARGVLTDEGDLAGAAGDELLGFGDDRFKSARAEFAAKVGNDAEGAGMVAALGDFDVGGGFWGGQEARGGFVVEVGGQQMGCALPVVAAEAALLFAVVAFGAECYGSSSPVPTTASTSGMLLRISSR